MGTIIFIIIAVVVIIAIAASRNKQTTTSTSESYLKFEEEQKEKENLPQKELSQYEDSFLSGNGGTINVAIKGLSYRTEDDIYEARQLRYGSLVFLKKESCNPKDPYAVAVYTKSDNHIGYVPKEYSKGISYLLDSNLGLKCTITKSTYDNIPFLYMDISYKSIQQQQLDKELETDLINRLKRIGLKETCKLRWEFVFGDIKPYSSDRTIEISASYNDSTGFTIKETLESKDGKIKEIEYPYSQNIGRNNYEIAERLEKSNDIENAILKYESNIYNIEECLAESAIRLSVLYKKVDRHKEIIPMLQATLKKAQKQRCSVDEHKISERMNMFLNNSSFMTKYGNEK